METSELALAAFLQIKGFKLKEIVKKNGSQAFFVFEEDPKILDVMYSYSNSEFARFESALRALRKLVYTVIKSA